MTKFRMAKSSMAAFFKFSLKPVSIPMWVCVVVLILLFMINFEIRDVRSRVGQLPESSLIPSFDKGESARSFELNAEARIEEALADDPAEPQDVEVAADDPEQQQHEEALGDEASESHHPAEPLEQLPAPDMNISEGELAALAQILEMRIAQASGGNIGLRTCRTLAAMNNTRGTCIDTTCPHHFHPSAITRIRQLLGPRFQLTRSQLDSINALAKDVIPKKYIFVTAASSNHYNESQALVFNLRQYVFNKLSKDSYSFLYFDLGLKPDERRRVKKNCNCTVMSINLKAFPSHARKLMCYAWKPFIIKALLPKTEAVVYMDSSVRFRDMDIDQFFEDVRRWGAQFLASLDSIPNHTVQSMFDFYEEPVCIFWPFPELLAGFSAFHNEPFMTRVVLDPWVSCAYNVNCMCPVDPHAFRMCSHTVRRVGGCHRFDLSSLTIQMAKLYGEKFGHLIMTSSSRPKIMRNDRMSFFTD